MPRLPPVFLAVVLAGCAAAPPAPDPDTVVAADVACAQLVDFFDATVAAAATGDGATARVDGFRTLRVDRLVASYASAPMDAARFAAWIAAMRALDREARGIELANLPVDVRARVDDRLRAFPGAEGKLATADERLDACAERVLASDLSAPNARVWLIQSAVVPDDYRDSRRALGLYPFTAFGLAAGIALSERETRAAFARETAPRGTRAVYRPPIGATPSPDEIRRTVATLIAADPLPPLPRADAALVDALFAAYAPIYAIDTASDDDRPGAPFRRADGVPAVDTKAPAVYTQLAWTRFDGALLPQLVYTIWFAQRTPRSSFDALAGRLDGLVWRVTLDRDGAPLAFDTIHPCGCQHQFVPTARLALRLAEKNVEEGAFVVQSLPELAAGTRVRLDLAAGTHDLRGVAPIATPVAPEGSGYALIRYATLRSLPVAGGDNRSLFGPDGIVAGTERAGRFTLWISGIESPGAMRQWGRHPTAFVGRRHFDEAFLIERYFTRR
ncbi:MAG: hypothetical protein ABI585_06430 [Betaproteobacteria bacterium]